MSCQYVNSQSRRKNETTSQLKLTIKQEIIDQKGRYQILQPTMSYTVADARPTRPPNFQKYLLTIAKGLVSDDICKICFLCQDLIPRSELERIHKGLQLFTEFKKKGLLSSDDISLLCEILQAINRIDLLNEARKWPTSSNCIRKPSHISRFRYLMLDLAMNCSAEDFEDTKHLAAQYVTTNNIKDIFHLFTELEKQAVIDQHDVSKLHEILMSNDQLIRRVQQYEASHQVSYNTHLLQQGMGAAAQTLPIVDTETMIKQIVSSSQVYCKTQPHLQQDADPINENQSSNSASSAPNQVSDRTQHPLQEGTAAAAEITDIEQLRKQLRDADLNAHPGAEASVNSIGPNEDAGMPRYPMKNSPHGYCLIINNYDFESSRKINIKPLRDRTGSDIDAQKLEILFTDLGYDVNRVNDLSAKEMHDTMSVYCHLDHTQCDCFIICILSHGMLGHVYGCDGEAIEIRLLTSLFTGVICPSLVGKPKVFFLQACQGSEVQRGVKLLETDDDHQQIPMIPNDCDFLIGYSTTPGYASLRSLTRGTWYIGSLVETIASHHKKLDMLNLLALVNQKISMKGSEDCKQASYQANNLTKALYL